MERGIDHLSKLRVMEDCLPVRYVMDALACRCHRRRSKVRLVVNVVANVLGHTGRGVERTALLVGIGEDEARAIGRENTCWAAKNGVAKVGVKLGNSPSSRCSHLLRSPGDEEWHQ